MRSRFHFASLALAAVLVPAAAFAGRGPALVNPARPAQLRPYTMGTPLSTHIACQLGEVRPVPTYVSGYLFPDEKYYTLLRISDCPGCGSSGLILTTAHVILRFPVACSIPLEVSVIGATVTGNCIVPDESVVICAPVPYNVAPPVAGDYDVTLNLPAACCIQQNAFLSIRFVSNGLCGTASLPQLGAAGLPCVPCFTYNQNPNFGLVDMCADPFWPVQAGNPAMFVAADCCDITEAVPHTWGRVKTLYR